MATGEDSTLGFIGHLRRHIAPLLFPSTGHKSAKFRKQGGFGSTSDDHGFSSASIPPRVLLLDSFTKGILSRLFSHSEFASLGVLLVDSLTAHLEKNSDEDVAYLRCTILISPNTSSVVQTARIVQRFGYSSFDLSFTSAVEPKQLERLVRADAKKRVQSVNVIPIEYMMESPYLFNMGINSSLSRLLSTSSLHRRAEDHTIYRQILQRLLSVSSMFFSSGMKASGNVIDPATVAILYPKKSEFCKQLAADFRSDLLRGPDRLQTSSSTQNVNFVVLIDRRDDPITPLLHPWTYQAQLCDMLRMEDGIVHTRDQQSHSLLHFDDPFLCDHYNVDFGELTTAIQTRLHKAHSTSDIKFKASTIKELKAVLAALPKTRSEQKELLKHATLVQEITEVVNSRKLFEVSELEQGLASTQNVRQHTDAVLELLANSAISHSDKLRICLLFTLRYERETAEIQRVLGALPTANGTSLRSDDLYKALLNYSDTSSRTWDIHQNKDFWTVTKSRVSRGLRGVENVYTQHRSLIGSLLDEWMTSGVVGQENVAVLACHDQHGHPYGAGASEERPEWLSRALQGESFSQSHTLIFSPGGVTHSEASDIQGVLKKRMTALGETPSCSVGNVLVGGASVISSTSFLADLMANTPAQGGSRSINSQPTNLKPSGNGLGRNNPDGVLSGLAGGSDDEELLWTGSILGPRNQSARHGVFSTQIA